MPATAVTPKPSRRGARAPAIRSGRSKPQQTHRPATQSQRMKAALATVRANVKNSGVKLLTLAEVNALMREEDE